MSDRELVAWHFDVIVDGGPDDPAIPLSEEIERRELSDEHSYALAGG